MMDKPVANFLPDRIIPGVAVALLPLICNQANAQSRRPTTAAEVEAMVAEPSNWVRWGDDDQLGALNLITPEKCRRAAALVTEGISVSLARNVETEKAADNTDPFEPLLITAAPLPVEGGTGSPLNPIATY